MEMLLALVLFAAIVGAISGVARWLGASRFIAIAIPVFPLVVWLIYCLVTGAAAVGHGVFPLSIAALILLIIAVPVSAIAVFGTVSRQEMSGIHLDTTRPFWQVSGETDFTTVFSALPDLLAGECILYFEGGSPTGEVLEFLREHEIPERAHVAYGTIWPKPRVFHLVATCETMGCLAELMRARYYPELAIHFHIYQGQRILLQWHDAFTQPMLLSGELAEQRVRAFSERLKMSYNKGSILRDATANSDKSRAGRPS